MKERKCKKCKLTYKGLKERCPFCHRLTKIGVFNRFMCVLGYIAFITTLIAAVYMLFVEALVTAMWIMPILATLVIIAIIVAIIVLVFK